MCDKVTYDTQGIAQVMLAIIWGRKSNGKKPLREYHCGLCQKWHLTSQPLRRKHETG